MAKKKYYQRPDGLFETSRTINGKRVVFRGRSCREVDQKILAYQEERKHGRKFSVIADEWEREKEKQVRASSMTVYRTALKRIRKHFTKPVGEITALDIKRYINSVGLKGHAKSTVKIDLTTLRQIFDHAVLSGDIEINPTLSVKVPKDLTVTIREPLTPEQEALVENCRTGDWWLLGLMLLYTGCRRGELLALEWKDIDRRAGVIHINKKLHYVGVSTPSVDHFLKSKNGERDIPLLPMLASILPKNRVGIIFPNEAGGHLSKHGFEAAWRQYCKDAGLISEEITEKGDVRIVPAVTPHQFRHSFATICYEAGLDELQIADVLGDTPAVARDVYTKLRDARRGTSAEKVAAYLEMRSGGRAATV